MESDTGRYKDRPSRARAKAIQRAPFHRSPTRRTFCAPPFTFGSHPFCPQPSGKSTPAGSSTGGGGSGGGRGGSGAANAMDPLELLRRRDAGEFPPGAGPRLRLVVNSCRRARWDARLGFFWPRRRAGGHAAGGRGEGGGGEERSALEVPLCTVVAGERRGHRACFLSRLG